MAVSSKTAKPTAQPDLAAKPPVPKASVASKPTAPTKKSAKKPQLAITQVKSGIGQTPAARKTLRALGCTKIGHQVTHDDTPAIRGMVRAVAHLVVVEEVK